MQQEHRPIILPMPADPEEEHGGHRQGHGLTGTSVVRPMLRQIASQPQLSHPAPRCGIIISREPSSQSLNVHPPTANSCSISETWTLHGSMITDDELISVIAEPSSSVPSFVQTSPFPPRSLTAYRPKPHTPEGQLPFGQYPVSRFNGKAWKKMWKRCEVNLNDLSHVVELCIPKSRTLRTTIFHDEDEFMGYRYRVLIDPSKCRVGLSIRHGTIVNVNNLNTEWGKYVVEPCQLIRGNIAFFPVHFREYDGQKFTSVEDSQHYSFILVVPSAYCVPSLPFYLRNRRKCLFTFHRPTFKFFQLPSFKIDSSTFCCFTAKHQRSLSKDFD